MADEFDEYRERIERRYHIRRSPDRYTDGGRRDDDYKSPPVFYWSDLWFIIPLVLSGLCMVFLTGCATIKRWTKGE